MKTEITELTSYSFNWMNFNLKIYLNWILNFPRKKKNYHHYYDIFNSKITLFRLCQSEILYLRNNDNKNIIILIKYLYNNDYYSYHILPFMNLMMNYNNHAAPLFTQILYLISLKEIKIWYLSKLFFCFFLKKFKYKLDFDMDICLI